MTRQRGVEIAAVGTITGMVAVALFATCWQCTLGAIALFGVIYLATRFVR